MKRFSLVSALCVITLSAFASSAEAKTCRFFHGDGGEAAYPGWALNKNKVVLIQTHNVRTLWASAACGKPQVSTNGSLLTVTVVFENERDESNVASGWRIYLRPLAKAANMDIPVSIKLGEGKIVDVTVKVRPNATVLAMRASKDAHAAKRKADEAYENSGGKKDVELMLSPIFSVHTPGRNGYGAAFGVNAILGKWGEKGVLQKGWFQLGLSGRLSWHYYEQILLYDNTDLTTANDARNVDVMAQEIDALAMFLMRFRFIKELSLDLTAGFGARAFMHDDSVAYQGRNYYIRGVEGRVAGHFIFGANAALTWHISDIVGVGFQYGVTCSVTEQVENPAMDGGKPAKGNPWNQFLLINLVIKP